MTREDLELLANCADISTLPDHIQKVLDEDWAKVCANGVAFQQRRNHPGHRRPIL